MVEHPGHYRGTVEDGRLVVPEGSAPPRLSAAIMAFWPEDLWWDAARVSYYESSWKYNAVNDTRHKAGGQCGVRYWYSDEVGWAQTEYSIGYFQINACVYGYDQDYWEQPDHNAAKAIQLYNNGGWSHWVVTARRLGLIA